MNNLTKLKNQCDNCKSKNVILTTNSVLYRNSTGRWPYIYYCLDCKASVSCHKNSSVPMGKMADCKTKRLRKKAHRAFDKIWQSKLMTRKKAYEWLSKQLCIEQEKCHISLLSKEQLNETIKISELLMENEKILLRRKHKNDLKIKKRNERNAKKFKRARTKHKLHCDSFETCQGY